MSRQGQLCDMWRTTADSYLRGKALEAEGHQFDALIAYTHSKAVVQAYVHAIGASKEDRDSTACNIGQGFSFPDTDGFLDTVATRIAELRAQLTDSIRRVEEVGAGPGAVNEQESFACASMLTESPCTYWFDNIIGLQDAKDRLIEGFVNPILYPNLFGSLATGVLLYGPPGTGKTLLAKALVNEMAARSVMDSQVCSRFLFFAPTTDVLKGKFVGETEKRITDLFMGASRIACRVQQKEPGTKVTSIIFIDEIDSLAPRRDAEGPGAEIAAIAVNTLIQMMDGVNSPKNVAVLAATNLPGKIDLAVMRRFQYQVPIRLPSKSEIVSIIDMFITQRLASSGGTHEDIMAALDQTCDSFSQRAKTASAGCAEAIAGTAPCEKVVFSHSAWTETGVGREIVLRKLTREHIELFADRCKKANFSPDDVKRLFKAVTNLSAASAVRAGSFYRKMYQLSKGADLTECWVSVNALPEAPAITEQPLILTDGAHPSSSMEAIELRRAGEAGSTLFVAPDRLAESARMRITVPPAVVGIYASVEKRIYLVQYDLLVQSGSASKPCSLFLTTKPVVTDATGAWRRWLRGDVSPADVEQRLYVLPPTELLSDVAILLDPESNSIAYTAGLASWTVLSSVGISAAGTYARLREILESGRIAVAESDPDKLALAAMKEMFGIAATGDGMILKAGEVGGAAAAQPIPAEADAYKTAAGTRIKFFPRKRADATQLSAGEIGCTARFEQRARIVNLDFSPAYWNRAFRITQVPDKAAQLKAFEDYIKSATS